MMGDDNDALEQELVALALAYLDWREADGTKNRLDRNGSKDQANGVRLWHERKRTAQLLHEQMAGLDGGRILTKARAIRALSGEAKQ
jgi:hypothetical protein